MTTTVRWLVVAVLALASCGAPQDDGVTETTEANGQTAEAPVQPTTPPPADPSPEDPPPATPSPADPPPATQPPEDPPPATPPPGDPLPGVVDDAVSDLAARLRVDSSQIEVLRSEQVTWPDGSLGCPRPGEFYTQALVDGYRVILGFDDRVYLYHAGSDAAPFLCPSDEKDSGHDFVPPPGFHQ